MKLAGRARIKRDVVYRTIGKETVLADVQTDSYGVLDPVGSRVWELLATHGRLSDVFDIMREEYDVDPKVLQRDLVRLVQELEAAGLVDIAG